MQKLHGKTSIERTKEDGRNMKMFLKQMVCEHGI
jgi:hypothetical protein